MPYVTREMLDACAQVYPEVLREQWEDERAAIRLARADPYIEHLVEAGCCPSLTIVDYGLPTQHVVYCEKYVAPGFGHTDPHIGLAGVDVPGWRTAPVPWQWSS